MFAPLTDLMSFLTLSILMQQSLYMAILLPPALLLSWLLRGSSPYVLMAIWVVVLARLIVPPNYESDLSLRSAVDHWVLHPSLLDSLRTIDSFAPLFSAPVFQGFSYLTWNLFGLLCWLIPSAWMLRRYLHRRANFYRLAYQPETENSELLCLVEKWRKLFSIRRRVRLVVSEHARAPFTLGSLRPRVVLPAMLVECLSAAELEAVVAHELAHVSRYDDLWISTEQWLTCIFFFHPAIWVCRSAMHRLREMICDRRVLATRQIGAKAYAKSLLAVIEHCQLQWGRPVVSGMVGTYAECRLRIELLHDHARAKTPFDSSVLAAIIIFSLLVILPMAPKDMAVEASVVAPVSSLPEGIKAFTTSPVPGATLGAGFGPRDRAIKFGVFGSLHHLHTGLDLYAAKGTPVLAMLDGVVKKAVPAFRDEMSMFRGGYIIIDHSGGVQSIYSPLSTLHVNEGDRVKTGATLAELGEAIMSSPGDHLHLEVRRGQDYLDPVAMIHF